MKKLTYLAAALALVGQWALAGVALAYGDQHRGTRDGAMQQSDAPAPASSPASSPSAPPDPSPAAGPSPSSQPSPVPERKYTATGPDGCGGVVPGWVFDTTSGTWAKADKGSFSCDRASGYYLSPLYAFDKRSGWYEIMPPAPASASQPDYLLSAAPVLHTTLGDLPVGSKDYQVAKSLGLLDGPNSIVSGTGSDSNNQGSVNNGGSGTIDLTNMINVINSLESAAKSGNVSAGSNTQVGNSVTGAASMVANLINLLASAWSWSNGNLSFFTQNILGSQNGDITLSPTQSISGGGGQLGGAATVSGTGPGSNNVAGVNNSNTLDVNAKSSGNIVNNVDLGAASGNVGATGNTSAGNVSSGQATAEVNIINLINSMINSGSSFFGILNIFGNLNGDVLFPNGFLNGLVPSASGGAGGAASVSGTGPASSNQAAITNAGTDKISNTALNGINNNVETTAASGNASASSNTSAGNVGSGLAATTQGLFNLANSSIMGDNAVLVIVNVLGHWIGKIMNLPGGSTESALLTGNATVGVHGTGADSTNLAGANNATSATIDQTALGSITNNVDVNAKSGDASATRNTSVGNVTTGAAKAASSVANIVSSVLNVKKWFGVLIINVFGDWIGDVNHNSAAGSGAAPSMSARAAAAGSLAAVGVVPPAVGLTATAAGAEAAPGGGSGGASAVGPQAQANAVGGTGGLQGRVLTAAAAQGAPAESAASTGGMDGLFGLSAVVLLLAGVLAAADRRIRRR